MLIRCALGLTLLSAVPAAFAGFVNVPADISVHLSAEPSNGLVTGQLVTFTISATNHGPSVVDNLLLISSDFVDEFDLSAGTSDCQDLGLVVVDGGSVYYHYHLRPTSPTPMQVGETRTCHITLPISAQAPETWTFGFGVAFFYLDINPANNHSEVALRRGLGSTHAIPTLSRGSLLLLAVLLLALAANAWRSRG
jgi:hypothetical protein